MTGAIARRQVKLAGSEHHPPHGSRSRGETDADQPLELTLGVRRRRNLPSLASLDRQMPQRRRYLTRTALVTRYGSDPAAVAQIKRFARAHGLTVTRNDRIAARVRLTGSVGALSAAFGVTLHDYDHEDHQGKSRRFHARCGAIHVPPDLRGAITAVFGFNTNKVLHHNGRAAQSTATDGGKSPDGFLPAQLAGLYNFPPAKTRRQCLAVLEFGGRIVSADLDRYFAKIGVTPTIEVVEVNKAHLDQPDERDFTSEVMLDIEIAGALAGDAKMVVYFSTFDEKGLIDCLDAMIEDRRNNPSVASLSWAWDENHPRKGNVLWSPAAIEHVNQSLLAAALLGITVCVATGDGGAEAWSKDGEPHVCFPASSPHVLAVGGTTLLAQQDADGGLRVTTEVVWNNGSGEGSGGGVSEFQAVPRWQAGQVPRSINPGKFAGRAIPDVAAHADGRNGYVVCLGGKLQTVGGTSAATPLWACLLLRINALLGARIGNFNALLYDRLGPAAVLRDITKGDNDTHGRLGGRFKAKRGWDPCTGWGVPDGMALLMALKSRRRPARS